MSGVNQDTIVSTSKTKNTKLDSFPHVKSDSYEALGLKNESKDSESMSK